MHQRSLAHYTSWRIGGPACRLINVSALTALKQCLIDLPDSEPVLWLGLGSNCLIRDGGIPGTVILARDGLKTLALDRCCQDSGLIYAEASVSCGTLSRFAAREGLKDLAFLAGIPGTVGGSLQMNAGCHGQTIWHHVEKVLTINRKGQVSVRLPTDYQIGYRHVVLRSAGNQPEEWFLAAYFRSERGEKAENLASIKTLLAQRQKTQPIDQYTCGSVFRNPEGHYAGRLIETAGLKGYAIGGAYVSPKHANFIVNSGSASALDIEQLIEHIIESVKVCHGVTLEKEVKIYGSFA